MNAIAICGRANRIEIAIWCCYSNSGLQYAAARLLERNVGGCHMRTLILFGFLIAGFVSESKAADSYCQYENSGVLVDGATNNIHLRIVVSSVPRPAYPGHPATNVWCTQTWRALGGYNEAGITQQPKLGTLFAKSYVVSYRGDKVGHDHFSIERKWIGRSNEQFKATTNYDVDVVASPF